MKDRNALVWGGLLILVGTLVLLDNLGVIHFVSRLIWALVLAGIGAPFLFVYLSKRDQWWALIPGCIMVGIAGGVLVGGTLSGIIITASIGLPFYLIFLTDRDQWWALIPGWVMTAVSMIILLAWISLDWFIAPFVMFAISAPFLLVYIQNRTEWWALIPGGIMAGIGVLILVGTILSSGVIWAIMLISLGAWMIIRAFRPSSSASLPPSQFEAPEAPDMTDLPPEPR